MSEYSYSRLSQPASIRLLQLLPSEGDTKSLRCELFEYNLRNSAKTYHPYEALSYVWGGEDKPCFVLLGNQRINVTRNLYAALLHLQACNYPRVVWVDAICINQTDDKEKEQQIPFMAEVYAKARSVLVWLGEAEDDGDRALEAIGLAGETSRKHPSQAVSLQQQILKLLQRLWFRRIWVLQEVAAARHISIICGSTEIDGHAFCLGLDALDTALKAPITQVAFLIRQAIFRPRNIARDSERLSLDVCSLGELVDMYHAYEATRLHDKIYALLGMCSDDLEASGLEPNYDLEWKQLMRLLVKSILGGQIFLETWNDKQMAVIKSKVNVLGKVTQVNATAELGRRQSVKIEPSFSSTRKGFMTDDRGDTQTADWILPESAISIQNGDIICLLQGASNPTIIRAYDDHFVIIMIAPPPSGQLVFLKEQSSKREFLTQDILLVWNWEFSSENVPDTDVYTLLLHTINWGSPETKLATQLGNVITAWEAAHILEDVGENEKASTVRHQAANYYTAALGEDRLQMAEIQNGMTLLSWAASGGSEEGVKLILQSKPDVKTKDKDGRSPLWWAAWNGHAAVVKLLLNTGEVEIDGKDNGGRSPLWCAARSGHAAAVKLLLDTGKVRVDEMDKDGRTLLWWAARGGHEAIVGLLLETNKVDVDRKDIDGRTPLLLAAFGGNETVVRLLLDTGKVEVNIKDRNGRSPLSRAAFQGHEAIVKLLLETGKVEVDGEDIDERTPLSWAAFHGHDAVVRLLLDTGKVEVDGQDRDGRTPLSWAAFHGHGAVVKLLLGTGKAVADRTDKHGRTPISRAASNGHKAVVKLLLSSIAAMST